MERLISVVGVFAILGLGVALSTNRRAIKPRVILWGLGLQLALALFILRTSIGAWIFQQLGHGVSTILDFSHQGAAFVFGPLTDIPKSGFIFAFQVGPTIIFVGALMSIAYHLGAMQRIVSVIAKIMMYTMGTSGAESLAAVACVFVGQSEAPLMIKPYIPKMTRSELMAMMTGGMSTIAGSLVAAYIAMGVEPSHILAASIMGAPAGLIMAKLMVPETEVSETANGAALTNPDPSSNVIEAAAKGAIEGMHLAFIVCAMLIAFIALVALGNGALGLFGTNLETILGYLFMPLAWIMGVPSQDVLTFGGLLGKKIVLNEFVAYSDLTSIIKGSTPGVTLTPRGATMATYALCGFANFSSIAINIGCIGGIAPERRGELAVLGLRAMVGGALASCLTATIAGILM